MCDIFIYYSNEQILPPHLLYESHVGYSTKKSTGFCTTSDTTAHITALQDIAEKHKKHSSTFCIASLTMTTTSHSSASRRPRSSPIAILRPGDEPTKRRSSLVVDSDDDDDFLEGGGVGALSLGTYVGSVPTKPRGIRRRPNNNNSDLSKSLPGAPMLASRSFEMRQG